MNDQILTAYEKIVAVINTLGLTYDEAEDALGLLALQVEPDNKEDRNNYAQAVLDIEEEFDYRITDMKCTKDAKGRGSVRVTQAAMPDVGEDVPVVYFRVISEEDRVYSMDRYNTTVFCKFHEQHPPTEAQFDRRGVDKLETSLMYGHLIGDVHIAFHRDGTSVVGLSGQLTIDSFIPVRVELLAEGK